jgi:hypothetical protein
MNASENYVNGGPGGPRRGADYSLPRCFLNAANNFLEDSGRRVQGYPLLAGKPVDLPGERTHAALAPL